MKYKGKLYGKVSNTYFLLHETADDFDNLVSANYDLSTNNDLQSEKIIELHNQRDELLELLKTFTICMDLGETENLENCCKTSKELIIKIEKCKIK